MRFEYATRDPDKIEAAKETLRQAADRSGQSIVGFHVFKTDSYPPLQASPSAKGVMHWIIWGFASQAELDEANGAPLTARQSAARSSPMAARSSFVAFHAGTQRRWTSLRQCRNRGAA